MKILAATDGSKHAEAAVRFAAWLASSLRGARLEVVLVGDVGADLLGQAGGRAFRVRSPMLEEYRRWARRALDRAAREARRYGVAARCHYVETNFAPVATVVLRAAEARRAGLVVVGSTGRGAVGRALLGSVARRIIHVARLPVVVVPARIPVRRGERIRLLAATDGSRGSTLAVRTAASLARQARRARLDVITVSTLRRDLALGFSSAVVSFIPVGDLRKADRRAADRILQQASRAARARGVRARLRFLEPRTASSVADSLAAAARRDGVHLIAVGSHGRGALEEWALGSVTRRLVSVSRRPLLVVRAPAVRAERRRRRSA
ncbi:MAG TPA: universal stress protein [Thermoanaerobaculia bacterium]|nr:universal stress protein [Thermoanaerobaculia bacterium]